MPRNYATMTPDPTYLVVWERAASTPPVQIHLPDKKSRTRLRAQLYKTRKILEAIDHEIFPLIQYMSITIEADNLVIDGTDKKIKEALAGIGIGAMEAPDFTE